MLFFYWNIIKKLNFYLKLSSIVKVMIKKKTFNTHKIATYHKYELYFFLYGLSVVTTRLKRSHYFYIFQNSRTFKQAVQGGSK